ncbi:hypothetical protein ACM66B_006362 [Microbotryomycetes sp. NB124-2]
MSLYTMGLTMDDHAAAADGATASTCATLPNKKKSSRQTLSCTECSRRKTKCDKVVPCSQCIKRGKSHLCKQELSAGLKKEAEPNHLLQPSPVTISTAATLPSQQLFGHLTDIKVTTDMLRDRIAGLEALLASTLQQASVQAPLPPPPSATMLDLAPMPGLPAFQGVPTIDPTMQTEYAYQSLTSSRAPSISSGGGGEEGRQAEQELEASVALEFLALGRHRNFDATQPDGEDDSGAGPSGHEAHVGQRRRRLPSIKKDVNQQNPQMPLLQYPTIDSLAAAFPERAIAEPIILHSIDSLGWHHAALHAPTFKRELSEFWSLRDEERIKVVDPAWLAILFAVLVVGVANLHPGLDKYLAFSTEEQNSLARKWFDCSMACLYRANFMQQHSLHTLQAIAVLVVSGQDAAGSNLIPTLLTAGISSAQELGLHRMCSDTDWDVQTQSWPVDVRVGSLVKREVAKRIFWTLCTQDWFGTAYRKTYMVQPTQVTTPLPCNMRDEDLLLGQAMNRPLGQYTVVSKLLLWIQIARCLQSTFEHLDTHAAAPSYEFLLQVDERLQHILEHAPAWLHPNGPTDGMPACVDWVRSTFVISSNHKVLTLHRPFLHRAFQDPRYQSSRRRAITASRTILREAARCDDNLFRLWTIPYHISAAACVVLLDLFQRCSTRSVATLMVLEAGGDDPDEMRDEVRGALKALQGMQETSAVASRGAALVGNLMIEEDKLRQSRGGGTAKTFSNGLSGNNGGRGVKRPALGQLSSPATKRNGHFETVTGTLASSNNTPASNQSYSPLQGQHMDVPLYSPIGMEFPPEFLSTFANSGSDWGLGFPQLLNVQSTVFTPRAFTQTSHASGEQAPLSAPNPVSVHGTKVTTMDQEDWSVPTNGYEHVPWVI